MKQAKKLLAIVLTLATLIGIFSCATPVFAAEVTGLVEKSELEAQSIDADKQTSEITEEKVEKPDVLSEITE